MLLLRKPRRPRAEKPRRRMFAQILKYMYSPGFPSICEKQRTSAPLRIMPAPRSREKVAEASVVTVGLGFRV